MCHPDIDIVLKDVSGFLARLLIWGLPPFRLPFFDIAYEDLTVSQDHLCRNLFMLAGSTNSESPVIFGEILPWQYPLMDDALADNSRHEIEGTKLDSRCEDENSAPISEASEATFDGDETAKDCAP